MVACPHDNNITYFWGINRINGQYGGRPVRLYSVLTMDGDKQGQSLRVVGVVVLALFIFGLILEWDVLFYFGTALLGIALLSSSAADILADLWMKFARIIGTFNSKILLGIIFYGFLTPIAVCYRLIQGTSIQEINRDESGGTYFVERSKRFSKDDFENPW
jgi:polyferredoxin